MNGINLIVMRSGLFAALLFGVGCTSAPPHTELAVLKSCFTSRSPSGWNYLSRARAMRNLSAISGTQATQ